MEEVPKPYSCFNLPHIFQEVYSRLIIRPDHNNEKKNSRKGDSEV